MVQTWAHVGPRRQSKGPPPSRDPVLGFMPRGLMSDLLARIAKDKDNDAFRQLYETFGSRVRGYMMRQGADPATAEELTQETLLTVWRKANLYSSEKGGAAAWIFTIARNLRIDRLRREVVWYELTDEMAQAVPSGDQAVDDIVAQNERQLRVRATLSELSDDQREVVTLAYIDGLSHSQIAERLSLPLGTVKSRMRLAYQKVRTALEDLQ
jgi:RNA polymerase sigma-70 factor, ECF subfamily